MPGGGAWFLPRWRAAAIISWGRVVSTAVSQSEITAGSVLAGKYRVERMIGQGGMGVVVEARHTTLDDRVALKFLLPEYAAHPEASQRFLREARAAVRIKSAHVARVSDVGTLDSGAPYMVMEFLEGADASHGLSHGQVLPLHEAVDYIVQACDALAEAHSLGIVHRDIKPANLFVTRHQDGSPFVKLLDFGISKVANEVGGADGLTRTTATMGSALYMSPEQIRQSKSVDHRTDIYALGVSLYELLTGRQPFIAENFAALCVEIATGTPTPLRELRPDIPPEFAATLERAYARDLNVRFQSIGELVVALSPWAPPRTQPIIERIARAAGLVPRFSTNPPPADPARGSYAHIALSESAARGLAGSSPGVTPAGTNLTGSKTVPPTTRSPLPALLAVGGVLVVLAVGSAGAFAFMKSKGAPEPEASAASAAEAPKPPDPTPSATAAEPPKVEPSVTASAEAPPAQGAAPAAAATKNQPKPSTKAEPKKPEPAKPEPAKPEPPPSNTVKKPNAEDVR